MRFNLLLVLILLFIHKPLSGEEAPKLIFQEMAIMKIGDKPVFFSEFNAYLKSLEQFRCLVDHSTALDSIDLDKKKMPVVPEIKFGRKPFEENREFVLKVAKLIKLQVYSNQFKLSLDSKIIQGLNKKKCLKEKFPSWPTEVKSMIQLEYYLRERFFGQKQKEVKTDVAQFVESINKKISHELFF